MNLKPLNEIDNKDNEHLSYRESARPVSIPEPAAWSNITSILPYRENAKPAAKKARFKERLREHSRSVGIVLAILSLFIATGILYGIAKALMAIIHEPQQYATTIGWMFISLCILFGFGGLVLICLPIFSILAEFAQDLVLYLTEDKN